MENRDANRKLNISAINFSDRVVSFDSAVGAKTLLEFPNEVVCGDLSIKVSKAEKDYVKKSIKMEMFYEQI